ncbi:MAG: hypothetical protein ACOYOB_20255, partial [Myxococcota bacterium]
LEDLRSIVRKSPTRFLKSVKDNLLGVATIVPEPVLETKIVVESEVVLLESIRTHDGGGYVRLTPAAAAVVTETPAPAGSAMDLLRQALVLLEQDDRVIRLAADLLSMRTELEHALQQARSANERAAKAEATVATLKELVAGL